MGGFRLGAPLRRGIMFGEKGGDIRPERLFGLLCRLGSGMPECDGGFYLGTDRGRFEGSRFVPESRETSENRLKITYRTPGGEYRLETVWDCLREASQLPNPDDITSNTQWSVVYDHVNRTADVVQRRQWEETHHFAIGSQ